jgi:hypothetical protein
MHTLHFLLIKADSAAEAGSEAENQLLGWGDENNWRSVGGIASEDGGEDIENHGDGRWALSFLGAEEGIPKEGTYFSRAVAYLRAAITDPVTLPCAPFSTYPDLRSALDRLSSQLRAFDLEDGDTYELWAIGRNLKHVAKLIESRRDSQRGEEIPQYYDGQYDEFGLTDLTESSEGTRRYLVFLDMHS